TTTTSVDDPAARWAREINVSWQNVIDAGQKTVAALMQTGRLLAEAKAAIPHGGWLRMFKDHADPVPEPIPFGVDRAERLMAIARHLVLANSANWRNLPPTISGLHKLAGLSHDKLKAALER